MIVTYWKGVFCAKHVPGEEKVLAKCGFAMHEPTLCERRESCRACRAGVGRRYWSPRVEHAARLRRYCNDRALAALGPHLRKLAESRALDADVKIPAPPGLTYKPFQRAAVAYGLKRKSTLYADQMGLGKDQPLTAKVLTPSGWTTMGSLRIGDLVAGSDGKFYPVDAVYPQGLHSVYRITFQDGAQTECGSGHLWEVTSPYDKWVKKPPVVMSTREILETGLAYKNGNRRYQVKMVEPPSFQPRDHLVDPYVMGYLIGNGGLSQSTTRVTVPDEETVRRIDSLLPAGYHLKPAQESSIDYLVTTVGRKPSKNLVTRELKHLKMMGHLSVEKFIPPEYTWDSVENRVSLLQGLLDSDGHIRPKDHNIEYSTSSPRLARDVQQLIWSLGGTAKIRPKKTPRHPSYRMSVSLPNSILPARLSRKLSNYSPRKKYHPCRTIAKIEEVGLEQTQCITVRSPDNLYVTDDFILTHNTIEILGFVNYVRPRTVLVLCPATLILNWRDEAQKWLVDDYRLFIPETCSEVLPADDGGRYLVLTNFEKVVGTAPRVERVRVDRIRRDSAVVDAFEQTINPKLVDHLAAAMAQGTYDKTVILVSGQPYDKWLYLHTGLHEVEAARRIGWETVPAIVLPRDRKWSRVLSPGEIRLHTPLSRSLLRKWDYLVVDEAHALKNPDSHRSRAVLGPGGLHELSARAGFATGTPMENYTREIWPLAAACCPSKFGNFWDFARRYCGLHQERRGSRNVWVSDGSTNQSELQQMLRTTMMIRRMRDDVLKELPPKQRQMLVFPDTDVDWSQYPELVRASEQFEEAYDQASALLAAARTQEEYLRAARELDKVNVGFTEMSEVRHKTALLKLPLCLKHADDVLRAMDCLVIFAHHKDVLEKIHEHYGDDSCVMYGDTDVEDRMPLVKAFQEGRVRVFIGGLRAAGTGITLTRACALSFFETDWNPATMAQGEDRLCRIGQKRMVSIYHPVLDHSLDANMVKKMLAKQAAVDKILDGREEVLPTRARR